MRVFKMNDQFFLWNVDCFVIFLLKTTSDFLSLVSVNSLTPQLNALNDVMIYNKQWSCCQLCEKTRSFIVTCTDETLLKPLIFVRALLHLPLVEITLKVHTADTLRKPPAESQMMFCCSLSNPSLLIAHVFFLNQNHVLQRLCGCNNRT